MIKSGILIFLIATVAMAKPIVGEYVADSENPQNICLLRSISLISKTQFSINVCSGTLIAPNKVATAEHCRNIFSDSTAKVYCGYQGLDEFDGAQFAETLEISGVSAQLSINDGASKPQVGYDLAIVTLKTESKIAPMALAKTTADFLTIFLEQLETGRLFLKKDAECRIAGYGDDNDGKLMRLHTATLQQGSDYRLLFLPIKDAGQLFFLSTKDMPKFFKEVPNSVPYVGLGKANQTRGGDSGGPMYCKIGDAWTLIGVHKGGDDFNAWSSVSTAAFDLLAK